MTRLVMLHDYPPRSGGGLALAAIDLAHLANPVADVIVLTSRLVDHFADDRDATGDTVPDVPVRHVTVLQAARLLRASDHLVIHWTFSYRRLSTLALMFGPRLCQSVVCVIHTSPAHLRFNRMRFLPRVVHRLLVHATCALFSSCQAVIALGSTHARLLREVGIEPTHVVPIPVGEQVWTRPGGKVRGLGERAQVRIGFAGELSRLKGADVLAFIVQALTPRYVFKIVGHGPLRTQLEAAFRALTPEQRACVTMENCLRPSNMSSFFASVDCLLVLSRTESQCRIALESMLAGVVVLARPVDGLLDIVRPGVTGFHIDCQPEQIDHILRQLVADSELLEAVRTNARRFARHQREQGSEEWRSLLSTILDEHASMTRAS